jgi:hypothetical protein
MYLDTRRTEWKQAIVAGAKIGEILVFVESTYYLR